MIHSPIQFYSQKAAPLESAAYNNGGKMVVLWEFYHNLLPIHAPFNLYEVLLRYECRSGASCISVFASSQAKLLGFRSGSWLWLLPLPLGNGKSFIESQDKEWGENSNTLSLFPLEGPPECTVGTVDPCISVHFQRTN